VKYPITLFLVAVILLTACTSQSQTSIGSGEPQQVLQQFFELLHDGEYAQASVLYAGSYENIVYMNPDVDPLDGARLFELACKVNGFQCLEVRRAVLEHTPAEGQFVFKVTFTSPEGGLFVLGPCCGADETVMPPHSEFFYEVHQTTDGSYKVMTEPVYVP
jgi:hypothetical protein